MSRDRPPPVASESWLAAIVDSSFAAIFSKDLSGRILTWNPAAERLYGYAPGEAIGAHVSLIVPVERRDELDRIMRQVSAGEAVPPFETRRRRRDGTQIDVLVTVSPIRGGDGGVVAASSMAHDISEQVRATVALREREARLQEIAANFPGVIFRRITYPDGRVEFPYVSQPDSRVFQLPTTWATGVRSPDDMAPFVEPEDLRRFRAALQEAMARMEPLEFEGRMRSVDGSVRWVRSISRPSPQPDGAVAWDGFAFDVTEQRQAQDELRARNAELRVIMDTVPAIIWLAHDPEARRITGSRYAAERLRVAPESEQSLTAEEPRRPTHFRVLKDGREVPPDELPVQRAARGEEVRGEEMEVVFDDGGSFWELVNASPVRDARGEVVGAVGAGIDVTERKRAEEQQKLLIAELDHRVKNTLATVQSIVRLTAGGGPQAEVLAGRIRALATAHNLLAESRWRGADLRSLLKEELRPYRKSSGERPRLRGPAVTLTAKAAQAISLVLHELATNAAKYGALSVPEGALEVSWEVLQADGRRLVLVWQERGGPPVEAPGHSSFGLQLIRSTLAHDMGGTAEIRFEPEGVVCRLELGLERAAMQAAPAEDGAEAGAMDEEEVPGGLSGRRILIVEDEYLVALEVERMVTAIGCEVVGPSGRLSDALDLALREPLDGAVVDVNLGGESVAPLAQLLRQRQVPFVLMTGYGRLDMLPTHLRDTPVLRKPVREAELVQGLRGALRRAG